MKENGKRKPKKSAPHNKAPKKDENFQWKKATRTLTFWLVIIVISIWFSQKFTVDERGELDIDYTKFRQHLENKEILKAYIEDSKFHGELKSESFDSERQVRYSKFWTTLPEKTPDDETAARWTKEYGVIL
ncbi:MAG: ATP-dependent metallopeptidase FtsH/Yme1/Tma family protein, partial [bacterium]